MNKSQMIDALATKTGQTKTEAEKNIAGLTEVFTEALSQGDEVTLHGFGSLKIKRTKGRTGRNPRSGEPITIAAKNNVVFSAAQKLKDAVNG